MAIDPSDPFAVGPVPMWAGPWPPDPSWDAPSPPPLEELPVGWDQQSAAVPELGAPVATPAAATSAGVQLGQPRPVAPPRLEPVGPGGDLDLIELEPEGDWSGLEASAPPPAEIAPLGAPDAVSGGGQDLPAPGDPYPGVQTDEERAADLGALDPVAFAQVQAKHAIAAEDEAAAKRLAAAAEDRQRAEDNERTYREAVSRARQRIDVVNAESDRLALEKVDPDGWMKSRNLFQTIAVFVTGIVGGLVQSRTGGPNQGLAMINNVIERHIDAQKANLAHRRSLLDRQGSAAAESLARADADRVTEEAFRQGAWKRTLEQIETERMQFDPAGTRALKLEAVARDVRGHLAAAQQAHADQLLKQEMEIGRYQMDVEKHQMAKAKAAGAGGTSASKVKYGREDLAKMFPGSPVPPEGVPPMTVAEYGQWADAARKGRTLTEPSEREKQEIQGAIYGPNGKRLQFEHGVPGGDPEETRKIMIYGERKADVIDEILAIRDRVGGESSWGNSPEFQRLSVLQPQLVILAKAPTEGMSSDGDMARLAASVGAADIASFRSQVDKLKEGRRQTTKEVNAWLKGHGYVGDPIVFPKRASAIQTPDQREAAKLIKSTTGEKGQSIPTIAIASPAGAIARGAESLLRSPSTTLPEGDEKAQIDSWVADARGVDPKRSKETLAYVRNLADKSRSPAIRKYAADAIQQIFNERVQAKVAAGEGAIKAMGAVVEEFKAGDEAED